MLGIVVPLRSEVRDIVWTRSMQQQCTDGCQRSTYSLRRYVVPTEKHKPQGPFKKLLPKHIRLTLPVRIDIGYGWRNNTSWIHHTTRVWHPYT